MNKPIYVEYSPSTGLPEWANIWIEHQSWHAGLMAALDRRKYEAQPTWSNYNKLVYKTAKDLGIKNFVFHHDVLMVIIPNTPAITALILKHS